MASLNQKNYSRTLSMNNNDILSMKTQAKTQANLVKLRDILCQLFD